ncbi:glyoxalase domain-containing protein 4-like [Daphnia carinata]|uniref:glyoxalase domain-containing protein 4-like n=1 Tax=Daphnia carinata TaxID=120202 RepID=UPI00257A33B8|nr:glyoxalase domain-containing protein 4-like [Daphnia carinata]
MSGRRALHFVFKVGDRPATIKFFKDVLGMKILRHEEFEEGCKATCNGPYDGKWSKTMVGYGPEDNHFVCELTYNYGLSSYKLGNDFIGLNIKSSQVLLNAESQNWPIHDRDSSPFVEAPGGYKFYIQDELQPTDADPVQKVALASSNKDHSLKYWSELLGLKVYSQSEKQALLGYADDQAKLELQFIGQKVDHAKAFGRIAFSCPSTQLKLIESEVKAVGGTILTPFVSLDTPGKATVQVVILADPDGHEICFVGDEGFRELSRMDPEADRLLSQALAADQSDEWFSKKGRSKAEA